MKPRLRAIFCGAMLGAALSPGCGPRGEALYRQLQHEDPMLRTRAAVRAGQLEDPGSVPYLVDRLGDEDEVVRFAAFVSLRRMTGKTLGYAYYDPPAQRQEAIRRWRDWLEGRRQGAAAEQKDRS